MSFLVVLAFFCILYYLVRLRAIPEDDVKERRHETAERRKNPARGA